MLINVKYARVNRLTIVSYKFLQLVEVLEKLLLRSSFAVEMNFKHILINTSF